MKRWLISTRKLNIVIIVAHFLKIEKKYNFGYWVQTHNLIGDPTCKTNLHFVLHNYPVHSQSRRAVHPRRGEPTVTAT